MAIQAATKVVEITGGGNQGPLLALGTTPCLFLDQNEAKELAFERVHWNNLMFL